MSGPDGSDYPDQRDGDGGAEGGDELLAAPRRSRLAGLGYAVAAALLVAAVLVGVLARHHSSHPQAAPSTAPAQIRPHLPTSLPTGTDPVILAPTTPLPDVGDVQLFARAAGAVVEIDFAVGRLVASPLPALRSTGPVTFGVTAAGSYVRPIDAVPGYFVPDAGRARPLSAALADASALPGPRPGTLWVEQYRKNRLAAFRLVSAPGGARTSTRLQIPEADTPLWASPQADGSGYVLVSGAHGTFDLRPDGAHRLPGDLLAGTLLASGGDRVLLATCSPPRQRECPITLVRLPGGYAPTGLGSLPVTAALPTGAISPDGHTGLIYQPGVPGQVAARLIDLRTGRFRGTPVPVDPDTQPGSAVFSPDGRWAFVVGAGGTLVAIDAATGAAQQIQADLPFLYQLASRSRA